MNTCQLYYNLSEQQSGPIVEHDLLPMFQRRRLQTNTTIWTLELEECVAARSDEGMHPQEIRPPLTDLDHTSASISLSYAGFWKRLAATFIDGIILTVGGLIIGFAFGFVYGANGGTAEGALFLGNILHIIIAWLYAALFESSSKQASLGKMALGIKVTDIEGNPISFGKASGRHFGKIISTLIFFIGFLMIGFTEKKQGLHDKMVGCLVVNA